MKKDDEKDHPLEAWESHWPTEMGAWFPGERVVFRGKNMFTEIDHHSWMKTWLYATTEKEFTPEQVTLFEAIWSLSASFPEPRLWNNRVATLAMSSRSTPTLSVAGATAVTEAIVYGHRPLVASFKFIKMVLARRQQGESLADILTSVRSQPADGRPALGKNRNVSRMPGFGRPMVKNDERIVPLTNLAKSLKLDGDHLQTAYDIENELASSGRRLNMNIATLMGALAADQGMTAREYNYYATLCCSAGILACAVDAENHPEGCFFPLRCSRIDYRGPNERKWPEEM